jgi:hypothetical protein
VRTAAAAVVFEPLGVEHHRHTQAPLRQESFPHGLADLFGQPYIATTNEDGGAVQIFRTACENRPMHQRGYRVRPDICVAEQNFSAGVERYYTVEHARLRIRVQLHKDSPLFAHARMKSSRATLHPRPYWQDGNLPRSGPANGKPTEARLWLVRL